MLLFRGCDLGLDCSGLLRVVLLRVSVGKAYYILTVNQCLN